MQEIRTRIVTGLPNSLLRLKPAGIEKGPLRVSRPDASTARFWLDVNLPCEEDALRIVFQRASDFGCKRVDVRGCRELTNTVVVVSR
jgi:hypothetical protein